MLIALNGHRVVKKAWIDVLREVNKVIAVTDEAGIHHIKYYSIPSDKVTVITNSVDLSLFKWMNDRHLNSRLRTA